jgi:phosphate transport system substrate-binding protein
VQFPILFIAIVPVVNLPGVAPGALTLDGPTLATSFSARSRAGTPGRLPGSIPGVNLPKLPIIVVHRSDASGTTWHFTSYLAAAECKAGGARSVPGRRSLGRWARPLRAMPGWSRSVVQHQAGRSAMSNSPMPSRSHLTVTSLINREGARVAPGLASFRAAATVADFS